MKKTFTLALFVFGLAATSFGVIDTVVVAPAPPNNPQTFMPDMISTNVGDTVRFIWGTGTHVISHDDPSPAWTAFPIDNNNTSYDLTFSDPGTYSAVDDNNQVLFPLTITVGGVSVPDLAANNARISAFPNPAAGMVTVTTDGLDFDRAEVYSIEGRLVSTIPAANTTEEVLYVDLSNMANGKYMLRLMNGSELVGVRELLRAD